MGKKSKCKSSCDPCSSSSSCDQCSSSSSSSTYGYCCNKFPKCKCEYVNKCAPIYYPNSYVGQYPCNPCPPRPCPPLCPPFPPSCPPFSQNCSPYNSVVTTITSDSTVALVPTSPNVNVYVTTSTSLNIVVSLPAISSLTNCNFKKMFVLSNLSGGSSISINASGTDLLTKNSSSTFVLESGRSITLYAVYTGTNTTNYWAVQV